MSFHVYHVRSTIIKKFKWCKFINCFNGCVSSECDQDTNDLALTKRMELIKSKHDTKKLLISLIL